MPFRLRIISNGLAQVPCVLFIFDDIFQVCYIHYLMLPWTLSQHHIVSAPPLPPFRLTTRSLYRSLSHLVNLRFW